MGAGATKGRVRSGIIPGYRIEARIGAGGMGRVYRAVQLSLNRSVAVKFLSSTLSRDPVFVKRFLDEAHLTGKLRHENIVSAIDAGCIEGRNYLVMEHVDGVSLAARLARDYTISEKETLDIVRQVVEGLSFAESEGFLHRDVKPANIMLTKSGTVKICDLGLTKPVGDPNDGYRQGKALLTAAYASPERIRNWISDHRSDMYSVGVMLYEMLSGRRPFQGVDRRQPRRLTGVSESTVKLISDLLQSDPDQRPQSYRELRRRIDRIRKELVTPVGRTLLERKRKTGRKSRMIAGASVAGVLVLLAAVLLRPSPRPLPIAEAEIVVIEKREAEKDTSPPTPKASLEPVAPLVLKINHIALAKAYCEYKVLCLQYGEYRERTLEDIQRLRAMMIRLEDDINFRVEHLRPDDRITGLNNTRFSSEQPREAARRLGLFVQNLRRGTHARIWFERDGRVQDLFVAFDEVPDSRKEVDFIPRMDEPVVEGPESEPAPEPEPEVNPWSAFRDPGGRAAARARLRALEVLAKIRGNPDYIGAAVRFLKGDAKATPEYFRKHDPERAVKYTALQHLRAVDGAPKEFAFAHLSEAIEALGTGHAGVRKAAQEFGMKLSRDKKVWGQPESIAMYDLAADPKRAGYGSRLTSGSFMVRYLAHVLYLRAAFVKNDGYLDALRKMKTFASREKERHVQALFQSLEKAIRCTNCKNGHVVCLVCGGTKKVHTGPCKECHGKGMIKYTTGDGSGGIMTCPTCHNRKGAKQFGFYKSCPNRHPYSPNIKCPECAGTTCRVKLERPGLTLIAEEQSCAACQGHGSRFRNVMMGCDICRGVGVLLIPVVDPEARLH